MAIGGHLFIASARGEHHGIDIGTPNNGTVIEYGGKGESRMSVRRVWRDDFLARGPSFVKRYAPETALPPPETVRLALARHAGQSHDPFNKNREPFARLYKTGHRQSPQAEGLKEVKKTDAVVGATAMLAYSAG